MDTDLYMHFVSYASCSLSSVNTYVSCIHVPSHPMHASGKIVLLMTGSRTLFFFFLIYWRATVAFFFLPFSETLRSAFKQSIGIAAGNANLYGAIFLTILITVGVFLANALARDNKGKILSPAEKQKVCFLPAPGT